MALKDPGSFEWKMVFIMTGLTDLAQWGIDFIPVYGEVVNEVSDPCLGVILGLYFQLRGISMVKRPSRLISLIGSDLAEQLSADVAPAWIIDAWYIHKTVADEWAMEQASLAETEEDQENQPLNRMVNGQSMRQPPVIQKPLNQSGVRPPNGGV
jgi:hypothetical protein